MISIIGLEIFLDRALAGGLDLMQHPDNNLDGLIAPDELPHGSPIGTQCHCLLGCMSLIIKGEAEVSDVHPQLLVGDSAIEVVVHLPHDLVDLMLRDCEAETLKQVLELVTLYETILVRVDLVEHLC